MSLQGPAPIPLEAPSGQAVLRPPPEAELVEAGRLSMGQLAQAHRDRLETGKQVLDIIVERGWVPAEEIAELRAAHGIAPPAPVQPRAKSPDNEESGPPPAARAFEIAIRLTNGDLVTAGETDDADKAIALGHAVVADLLEVDQWPFFGGRYITPDPIVSVDLLPAEPAG